MKLLKLSGSKSSQDRYTLYIRYFVFSYCFKRKLIERTKKPSLNHWKINTLCKSYFINWKFSSKNNSFKFHGCNHFFQYRRNGESSSMRLDKRKWQIVCILFSSILMVTLCLRQLFRTEFSDTYKSVLQLQKKCRNPLLFTWPCLGSRIQEIGSQGRRSVIQT